MWFQRSKDPETGPLADLAPNEVFVLAPAETTLSGAASWVAGYLGSEAMDLIMRTHEVTGDSLAPGLTALAAAAIAVRLGLHGAGDFAHAIGMRIEDQLLDQNAANEQAYPA